MDDVLCPSKQVVDVFFVSILSNACDVIGDDMKTDFHGLRVTTESQVFEDSNKGVPIIGVLRGCEHSFLSAVL